MFESFNLFNNKRGEKKEPPVESPEEREMRETRAMNRELDEIEKEISRDERIEDLTINEELRREVEMTKNKLHLAQTILSFFDRYLSDINHPEILTRNTPFGGFLKFINDGRNGFNIGIRNMVFSLIEEDNFEISSVPTLGAFLEYVKEKNEGYKELLDLVSKTNSSQKFGNTEK